MNVSRLVSPAALGLSAALALLPHAARAAAYTLNSTTSPLTLSYDGVIDTLTVTQAGLYDFTITGADGGSVNGGAAGGLGASLTGSLDLPTGNYDVAGGGQGGGFPGGGGGARSCTIRRMP